MTETVKREVIIKTCRHCGTVLATTPIEKLEDVKGLEYATRALEVAAVGDHPIVFLSDGNPHDTKRLATIAKNNFGCTVFALQPCVCGNAGSATHQCTCSPSVLARYRRRPQWIQAMETGVIFVQVAEVPYERRTTTRAGEDEARIQERIALARARPIPPSILVDHASMRLIQAAQRQLQLDAPTEARVIALAGTIARMDSIYRTDGLSKDVSPAHLAEAVQYRPRWSSAVLDD